MQTQTTKTCKWLDYKQVADIMSVSQSTIRNLVSNGNFIKPIMLHGVNRLLFSEHELSDYMQAQLDKRGRM